MARALDVVLRSGARLAVCALIGVTGAACTGVGEPLGAKPVSVDAGAIIEDGVVLVTTPSPPARRPTWSEDRAIAIARTSLRRRGLGLAVAGGPMMVVLDRSSPDAAIVIDGEEAIELAGAWPSDASIVLTAAGRWWVWEYGAVAPADSQARTLASQASGTRS